MLAAKRDPKSGINCEHIAALLLYPNDKKHLRDLAQTFYKRLDIAARTAEPEETEV